MTVFIVHPVRDDLSPALKFGDFRFINQRYINADELDRAPPYYTRSYTDFAPDLVDPLAITTVEYTWTIPHSFNRNMSDAALDFVPATDYLLIAGDHLQIVAMTGVLFSWFPSFSVLRYDRRINEYIPVRLYSGLREDTTRARVKPAHIGVDIGQETITDDHIFREGPGSNHRGTPGYPPKVTG